MGLHNTTTVKIDRSHALPVVGRRASSHSFPLRPSLQLSYLISNRLTASEKHDNYAEHPLADA